MSLPPDDVDDRRGLAHEHQALLVQYGRVQTRCSEVIAAQAREIESLKAQTMRLRAAVMQRDTALAVVRQDHADLQAAIPGLPRRVLLARRVEALVGRLQDLMRERLRWQQRHTASAGATFPLAVADADLRAKSVLCVGPDAPAAISTQRQVELAGGQFLHHDGDLQDSRHSAALDASLKLADLVICQTGCVSHNAYWRVQDHCTRTGKPCVLVGEPQAMFFVRSWGSASVDA